MSDTGSANRYVGSRSFEDTRLERALFFGRDREKIALLDKILAEDVVVLHGKSGLGKTSLLKAGVFQQLRKEQYWPTHLRLNNVTEEPVPAIQEQVIAQAEDRVDFLEYQEADRLTDFFDSLRIWTDNELLTPVLVLDQFEEVFTLWDANGRERILREVSELIRQRRSDLASPASRVKVVFSLREDFLGELEGLSTDIPQIAHNRFRLLPLSPQQAYEAIKEPAKLMDDELCTSRFFYYADTIDQILAFLSRRWQKSELVPGEEIEPFQLQILCQEIEKRATEEERTYITPRDLGGNSGMRRILQGYYQSKVKTFPAEARPRIRRLCEELLISKRGRRLPLEESEVILDHGVSAAELRRLVDLRLLRVDPRLGTLFYELSHDSLVEPILEARKAREGALARARIQLQKGHPALAVKLLEQALDEKTEDGRLLHLGGRALAERLDYKGALELFEKALETSPDRAPIYLDIGDAWRSYRPTRRSIDPHERALEAYNKALEIDPDDIRIRRRIALLHSEKGDFDGAIAQFQEAVSQKPRPGFFEELVEDLRKRKEVEAARRLCHKALGVGNGSAAYYFNVAWELDALEEYEEALKAWKASWDREEDPETLFSWGNSLCNLKRFSEADQKFEEAVELKSDYADAYFNWGASLLEQERFEEAGQKFRKTLGLDPSYSEAYLEWGNALAALGRWKKAIERYESALEQRPDHVDAMVAWGDALRALDRTDEAIEKYREALRCDASSVEAIISLAESLVETGDKKSAIDRLSRAAEEMPDSAELKSSLARIFLETGDRRKAVVWSREALDLEPRSVSMRGRLALALTRAGELSQAEREYLETVRQAVRQGEEDELKEVLEELRLALSQEQQLAGAADLLSRVEAEIEMDFSDRAVALAG